MKKLLLAIMIAFLLPAVSFADEVGDALPSDTPAKVMEGARQAIHAGVESQAVIQMTQTMLRNEYKEKQMLQAYKILMKAKQENLPQEPLMNKFNQSVTNKDRARDTIKAMDAVRTQFKTASDLAGEMTRDRTKARVLTEDMAQCMESGVKSRDMKNISTSLQKRTKDMTLEQAQAYNKATLGAVQQIARVGTSSGSTSKMVRNALEKNYSLQDMEKLQTAFMAEVKNAGSATKLANSFANAIRHGASADNVGSQADRGSGGGFSQSQGSTSSGSGGFGGSRSGGGGGRR